MLLDISDITVLLIVVGTRHGEHMHVREPSSWTITQQSSLFRRYITSHGLILFD